MQLASTARVPRPSLRLVYFLFRFLERTSTQIAMTTSPEGLGVEDALICLVGTCPTGY
jgi:hypothetical protein